MLIRLSVTLFGGIPPRDAFVILRVNGVEYDADAEIPVRSGEIVEVEAILKGGKRDYCEDPQTYANIGKNTVILSQGENGMSFEINSGQYHGDWKLTSEKADFSSGTEISIVSTGTGDVQRTAEVEFKSGNYQKIYFKVSSSTDWHYVRNTPAGKTEQDEHYEGTATFYFVIQQEEGVWYSSNNIKAKGAEDFSVRNNLDRIQSMYDDISKALMDQNWSSAEMHFNNLKNSLDDLKSNIKDAKEKDSKFECEITLIGLPSDKVMEDLEAISKMSTKWKESFDICNQNSQEITENLLKTQNTFSANILRSIFKNYINWGTSIPTSPEDLLSVYDPKNIFGPIDLPRKVLGWYEEAEKDASILKNQANSIQKLTELRDFYQKRADNFVQERKEFVNIIVGLRPAEKLHAEMQSYISGNSTVEFQAK